MKLERLLFKRKISIIGVILFVIFSTVNVAYKVFKWSVFIIRELFKKLYNYIKLSSTGYSYEDIKSLINNMTGREFEIFCAELFKANGYKTILTPTSNDGGKDLVITNKIGETSYVEIKRWSDDWEVGRPELQKLIGATVADKADYAIFITSGKYNTNAYEYARKIDNLILMDLSDVFKLLYKVEPNQLPRIIAKTFDNQRMKIIKLKPC